VPDEPVWTPQAQTAWGVVVDVEASDNLYVTDDGRQLRDSKVTVTEQAAAEMHHGYRCARCLEDLRPLGAFPERCPVCQFEVARYQRQALEEQYKGVDTSIVGPLPVEREMEYLERFAREEALKRGAMPKMSIPRKPK
jgi:hypothetical protein